MSDKSSSPSSPASGRRRKIPLWKRAVDRYLRLGLFAKVAFWCVVLSPFVAVVGYKVAKPVYRNWKQANALRLAERYAAEGDLAAAMMSFRKAIRTNHRNPDAWRRIAVYLDDANSPDAVMAWSQVVRLDEDDLEARFRLIDAAVQHRRRTDALEAIEKLPASARDDARYHRAMGALAGDGGDFAAALEAFDKAWAIDPSLEDLDLLRNIAALRAGDAARRVEAVDALEALGASPDEEGAQALRELFAAAVQREDIVAARVYAGRLMEHPEVSLRDRLVAADLELQSGGTFFPLALQELREIGRKHPEEIPAIANYFLTRGRVAEVEQWLDGFPEDSESRPQVQAARFEIFLAKGDPDQALEALAGVSDAEGGAIPAVTIESAKQALELRESSRSEAMAAWEKALESASRSPAALLSLVKLARAVGWEDAQRTALWTFVEQRPTMAELWFELVRLESGRRNLQGVQSAVEGALRASPDNLALRSNYVIVSYLLGKGDPAELLEMAQMSYDAAPDHPVFITSYALALANAGETERAVEIIDKLPASEREVPERALYAAVVYAAASRPDEARAALSLAEPALGRMLPEEGLLHRATLAKLDGRALSNEDVAAALRSSVASPEEKEQLAEALRDGRTRRDENVGKVAAELREARPGRGEDSADVLQQLQEQRAGRAQSRDEMKALVEELRRTSTPAAEEAGD